MAIGTDIPASELRTRLAEFVAKTQRGPYTRSLKICKQLFLDNVRKNFTSSATADGKSWPPRKSASPTRSPRQAFDPWQGENKRDDGHPLLIETGALLQAAVGTGPGHVSSISDTDVIEAISLDRIKYARAHDQGYKKGNLPQRRFYDASPATIDKMAEAVADDVLQMYLDS